MSTAVAIPPWLTAEEYVHLPDEGVLTELVRGRKLEMNRPFTDLGFRMSEIAAVLRDFVRANNLGRVVVGDAGVVTQRNPDTVRGPDIAFYSYQRVPPGPTPQSYWPAPELTVEIRSPNDRWQDIYTKIGEYFDAGVLCVLVIDPDARQVQVYTPHAPVRLCYANETLTLSAGLLRLHHTRGSVVAGFIMHGDAILRRGAGTFAGLEAFTELKLDTNRSPGDASVLILDRYLQFA